MDHMNPRFFMGCQCVTPIILGIISSTCAFASSGYTLSQLTQIALQNNQTLQAAKANVEIAKARVTQAGQLPNPSLILADTNDEFFSDEGEYTRGVGISQDLPISGRIARQKNVAKIDVAIAQAEIVNAQRKLQADVANNFYALLMTQRRLTLLTQLLTTNQQLVNVVQKRLKLAEISEIDATTVQLDYQQLLQEKLLLSNQVLTQQAALNTLLGREPASPLPLQTALPILQTLPSLPMLQASALQHRPDLQELWLNVNRNQADAALARAQRWGDWTFNAGVEENKQVVTGAPPQNADKALALSIAIPLPLLNTNKGRIQAATSAQTQAQIQLQALQLAISSEVTTAYTQAQTVQNILRQNQQQTLPLSEHNVHLAQQAYGLGQLSLIETLQAQRQNTTLQLNYLTLWERYLQALVNLQLAVGDFSLQNTTYK